MGNEKWSRVGEATSRAVGRAASWAASETRAWNSRRPERGVARAQRQALKAQIEKVNVERKVAKAKLRALKAEGRRAKAERKKLKGVVRRTCKQCGHEWTITKRILKAGKRAGIAPALESPTAAIAKGNRFADVETCARCGSVGFFDEAPAANP